MKKALNSILSILTLLALFGCSPAVEITSEYFELFQGQNFIASDFLVDEFKTNENIEIEGVVNTQVPGNYEIVYSLGSSKKKLSVVVKEDPINLIIEETEIELGKAFDPLDYISSEDKNNKISIINEVNNLEIGKYKVVYKVDNVEKTLFVSVKNIELELSSTDISIDLGSEFNPKSYLTSNFINSDSIKIDSNVNTSKVGVYKVRYLVNDDVRELIVNVKDVSPILTKSTISIPFDGKFEPRDYLIESDKQNKDIVIDNPVNSNIAGIYTVTYSIGNIIKNLQVTVKEKVEVKKVAIQVVSLTSPVNAGQNASIQIKGTPNTVYSISVYYKSGASTADGLYSKTSDNDGIVEWTWKVGSRTSSGSWEISIRSNVDSISTYFTVQ